MALSVRLRCLLAVVFLGMACADDEETPGLCEPVGDERPCGCADNPRGYQLCLPDGTWSECNCEARRVVPCVAPGVVFACSCPDGHAGMEICLASGDYTSCDCQASAQELDAATPDSPVGDAAVVLPGSGPSETTTPASSGTPSSCPSGFSCVAQMGFQVCADATGLPPVCTVASDCEAAGLPEANCIDPMLGGILVCAQLCQP